MDLERQLAEEVLASHPSDAARLLEGLPVAAVASPVERTDPETVAPGLAAMASHGARAVLTALPIDRSRAIVEQLPVGIAAQLLRGLAPEARVPLLSELPNARAIETLLRFPDGTAGALMDPEVLSLPAELTAAQALERVRGAAGAARYNLYVVDREHRLVGVLNQRDLLMATSSATLDSVMVRPVKRLRAEADRLAVVAHPGWQSFHSMPVVDSDGIYLGAIRYRAFRDLEGSLRRTGGDPRVTSRALGDLFRTGASAMLEVFSPPDAEGAGGPDGR